MIKRFIFFNFITFLCLIAANNLFGMNIIKPYDVFLRPDIKEGKRFQIFAWTDAGLDARGFNSYNDKVNVLQIWNNDQNAIAMLNGSNPESTIGELRTSLGDDDGCRGHFCVNGELKPVGTTIAARYILPYNISLGLYFPVYSMKLDKVTWNDLTPVTDVIMREDLTNNFAANVKELGCLDICGWRRTGLGDTMLVAEWQGNFKQRKPMLKKVLIDARFALSMPTGLKRDEDKLFAIPFGSDGAWGAMFGGGIDLIWIDCLRAGLDVEITHLFGHNKLRRIKTDFDQTDLLLLQKDYAYKDYGLTQQFTLHGQLFNLLGGLVVDVGYRFIKHGADTLILSGTTFSDKVANSAEQLKECTSHQMLLRVDYDFGFHMREDAAVIPKISLFGYMPFNGKRVAVSPLFGIMATLSF